MSGTPPLRSPSPTPTGPKPILRLKESVINKIAAGEIIHRPASALKELLENSLDAGATSIRITIKDGGMKLLQIQDNGCGIRKSDLPILAERFTTSKLTTYSDLSRLTTYGFRGEALASMSHVAHLTVITKTKSDSCAWKACYEDGVLTPAKQGLSPDPKPCAGNDGTIITVEDLFYNTPTRLSALRSSTEEYARILDVVTKYAVHNPLVAFLCKKANSNSPDLSSPSSSTTVQAIGLLYGSHITKNILSITRSSKEDNHAESWSAELFFTNANYQAKKMIFLLFINHRLVDSPRIKKSLESIYNGILPKGAFPFIYLSLQVDPRSVDVNVHPTKREVHFLREDEIVEEISNAAQEQLIGKSQSRVYEYHQTSLSGGPSTSGKWKGKGKEKETEPSPDTNTDGGDANKQSSSSVSAGKAFATTKKKVASQHKVRTSAADRTLDSMFPVVNPARRDETTATEQDDDGRPLTNKRGSKPGQLPEIKETECYLASVQRLREAISKTKHQGLTNILEKHVFVGIVDLDRCLSLIQHSTQLYLINHGALAEELFFQLGLRQFGDYTRLKLEPPAPLRALVALAVEVEEGTSKTKMTKPQITDRIVKTIMDRREMLSEYFFLNISDTGLVESLPLLLKDYTPNLDKLPLFLMRLGPQVNWGSEAGCFETFLRELAYFYVPGPLNVTKATDKGGQAQSAEEKAERWQIQHILFPTIRRYLTAPKSLLERDVVQVASLPDLYRVFERC